MKHPCDICGRREGEKALNRYREPDMNCPDVPLGPVVKCLDCNRLACPDCYHERTCCDGVVVWRRKGAKKP